MSSLPPLTDIQDSASSPTSSLAVALSILFEHSPILVSKLEPQLHEIFRKSSSSSPRLSSYAELIDLSLAEIAKWDIPAQSEFISGHPRIGESSNLSKLSAKEQGAQGVKPTPPELLKRLEHLNAAYEAKYPGLRYITFVNGRSRAAIAEEMEGVLGWEHSLGPDQPSLDTVQPVEKTSEEWLSELKRAVEDVGKIAKSRLGSLGVV
jgi:2-oxo-4-hydroxy-4-carboxy--5-ureidoimidazoline (OHCU) decarboxylase